MIVIGLMSGTSADGVSCAVVEIRGAPPNLDWQLLHHQTYPYPSTLRDEILACAARETATVDRLCALNFDLAENLAQATQQAAATAGLTLTAVDLIGSHGQTVWHIPQHSTLQIGAGALLAERTGVTTISNFRVRDVAAGGHGAPLVAYVDRLLLTHPVKYRAAQNIGGIGNVTFLPPAHDRSTQAFAFDTGPGNMLIDYAASLATDGRRSYDLDGELARRGTVDPKLLKELMAQPFLKLPPPKSTGRELYHAQLASEIWQRGLVRGLRPEDLVATLTDFTAESIARAYRDFLPIYPDEAIISGGGGKNPTLMARLREKLAPASVRLSDELGLPIESKEAIAFAILAYETAHGRPGNLPAATGATHSVVLGDISPGRGMLMINRALPVDKDSSSLTEANNPATVEIDALTTLEMVQRINTEDMLIAPAVAQELPYIAEAIDSIVARMRVGGRLIYVGAGTSGRLGVLDAAEMTPTFGTSPELVRGLIAGGHAALTSSIEGAEDDETQGHLEVENLGINTSDAVVGLTASGRTPFVIGALRAARAAGALTIGLACNRPAPLQAVADIYIAPLVGPEVIAGSTRLKAGTAEKMVLNLISTGTMIRLGKTYGNLMVDVQPTNAKLRARSRRIVERVCGLSPDAAEKLLASCDGHVKTALVAGLAGVSPEAARRHLAQANDSVRAALNIIGD
jgi:N-acetylmuramic acid 6-phosphate etherase